SPERFVREEAEQRSQTLPRAGSGGVQRKVVAHHLVEGLQRRRRCHELLPHLVIDRVQVRLERHRPGVSASVSERWKESACSMAIRSSESFPADSMRRIPKPRKPESGNGLSSVTSWSRSRRIADWTRLSTPARVMMRRSVRMYQR